jgi:hypothetical protein
LLRFIHACNLLVGFPYFGNPKSFWACFVLAFEEPRLAGATPTFPDLMTYPIAIIPTLKRLFMDKFGIFYDLVMVETYVRPYPNGADADAFWIAEFEAKGFDNYLVCCYSVTSVDMPTCHVMRARGSRNKRTWTFESFDCTLHEKPLIGSFLGKQMRCTFYSLHVSEILTDLSLHLEQVVERDKLLFHGVT